MPIRPKTPPGSLIVSETSALQQSQPCFALLVVVARESQKLTVLNRAEQSRWAICLCATDAGHD